MRTSEGMPVPEAAGPRVLLRGTRGRSPACAGTPGSSRLDPGFFSGSCASVCSSCCHSRLRALRFSAGLHRLRVRETNRPHGFDSPRSGSRRRVSGSATKTFLHGLHSVATVLSASADAGRRGRRGSCLYCRGSTASNSSRNAGPGLRPKAPLSVTHLQTADPRRPARRVAF